ncbi:hypothetical protein BC829DRAFT_406346 [Chytridium lagenaria]|nr:hypothetical protein BC829DRAFT_406346 [Chytridium lagenaria]
MDSGIPTAEANLIARITALRIANPSLTFKNIERDINDESALSSSDLKKAFNKAGKILARHHILEQEEEQIKKRRHALEVAKATQEASKIVREKHEQARRRLREQHEAEQKDLNRFNQHGSPMFEKFMGLYPTDVSPLYPGPPDWIHHPEIHFPSLYVSEWKLAKQECQVQSLSDLRWRRMTKFYASQPAATLRTGREHRDIHESFGFTLDGMTEEMEGQMMKVVDVMNRTTLNVMKDFVDREKDDEDDEGGCNYCGKETRCRCQCGEFWCSKECQVEGWKRHREACEMVKENQEVFQGLNHVYWTGRFAKEPRLLALTTKMG